MSNFSRFCLWILVVALGVSSGCASAPKGPDTIELALAKARLERIGELPVLYLSGSPFEMGLQHGALMREEVRDSIANVQVFIKRGMGIPLVGGWWAKRRLDHAWKQMLPYIPERYLEELRGLSKGSGIDLRTLQRVHALPELTSTHCASFAAFGEATQSGRLIQIRNLDWSIQSNVQASSALFVVQPDDQEAFVNIGWLGFIGVISGINQDGISVAEIGAETIDEDFRGTPMPFLLRRILEESQDLDRAVQIVDAAPRTTGFNYLFADAQARRAVALETTRLHCAIFWVDQEGTGPYRIQVPNAIFRSDFALDPTVRNLQTASNGDPDEPGLESPEGSSAYQVRYRRQGELLLEQRGTLDPAGAIKIAQAIAPGSNIQSIVYAYPQMWVAVAKDQKPAAQRDYLQVDLELLFSQVIGPPVEASDAGTNKPAA